MADQEPVDPPPGGPAADRLQSLLSRAAEQQLSEQRQVATELAQLRALVVRLDERLRDDGRHVDVASWADALAPRVADLLVERIAAQVTASLQAALLRPVLQAGEDTERRLAAHVDEAVVAVAEVLLRSVTGRAPRRPSVDEPTDPPTVGGATPDDAAVTEPGVDVGAQAGPHQPAAVPPDEGGPAVDGAARRSWWRPED